MSSRFVDRFTKAIMALVQAQLFAMIAEAQI
jgi:hypothetical protein